MKTLIQWTQANPEDWLEIDSSQFSVLARKAEPVGGELIDNTPGWIAGLNIQGVNFVADHYHIRDVPDGIVVTMWNDDPTDFPVGTRYARVWTILSIAPDANRGGALNTRQSEVIYADTPGDFPLAQNTTVLPWADFTPPVNPIHGIQVSDSLFTQHKAARRLEGWRNWTEGLDASELGDDGRIKPQRDQGRFNRALGTITYFSRDIVQAISAPPAAMNDFAMNFDTDTAATSTQSLDGAQDLYPWYWATVANQPNDADWPNGTYRAQLDVTVAAADIIYGLRQMGATATIGHFSQLNSGLSSEIDSAFQSEAVFSGTGLKLATQTWDPAASAAGDRYGVLCGALNTGSMMGQDLTVELNTSDSFNDGPWTAAAGGGSAYTTPAGALLAEGAI